MHRPALRDWLAEQPFHLALSAGFFGFFAHAGFVAVLEELSLLPASVSGSSAGALVGGLWASGVSSSTMRSELCQLRRPHFWDPHPGFGLLRGRLFLHRVEQLLGARSFDQTRVPFTASVFDLRQGRTVAIRSGALAPAICASCALPGMFHPVTIEGRPMLDGGVADRPAHIGMPEDRRVLYHHLASRSPWRIRAPRVPVRARMVAIALPDLPRPGPFRLERGPTAFDAARARFRALMSTPVDDSGYVLIDSR